MEIDEHFSEFYGILLGDGCISKFKNQGRLRYAIRIDGNLSTDLKHYSYIKYLVREILGKNVKIKHRKGCNHVYIMFQCKVLAVFLHDVLEFPYGKKNGNLNIPRAFRENEKFLYLLLRGLFDTDGCIYFTKNNSKIRNYPIIELSTHDTGFLKKLKDILEKEGFNTVIGHYKDSIKLHGKDNVVRWMLKIGSKNIDKYSKFLFWKKYGYCPTINELPLTERLKKLKSGPGRI